ncbi:ArsC family reductase [Rhizobium sp. Root482]|uniref:ArsC family reductase n=1 Tax=Rhizobium sp. Root482 TaxID=1736543 RepID=UPI0006F80C37|nr:ArsC family reductase [Rhizobium sp. Root482]KQY13294.1 ArsC family transcriptional regulator [Rhizobium sp. Root482]
MTTIYGIRNCDTMKKARAWLEGQGIAHDFHDYKQSGVSREMLSRWCAALGWETVLNRAGTTFRALPEAEKAGLDEDGAVSLMLAQPSMIKRPILDRDGELIAGFKPDIYEKVLAG